MSTDRLTDSLDRPWVPGTVLGRGTWGRSRIVRDPQGREAVLKEPLTEADFPADAPLPDDLLAACRNCARQQAELLQEGSEPYLPRLEATVELGGGRLGLVLPRYTTLQRRLERGMPIGDVLHLVHRVASTLADAGRVHGNLRPTNIVFGERDQPFLADLSTPALGPHQLRLVELADARHWLPPEAKARPTPRWDTWALCQILYGAILAEPAGESERSAPLPISRGGLDKVALATLKDAAHARLAAENSNPRFRGRVTDRVGALLSRGLSANWEPSPPYRFSTARDLADRVAEILALLHPRVVEVGRILLPAGAADGVFQSGSELTFTVTVGCTQGITDHEDIVCGLQLVDLDATEDARRPVEDTKLVVQVHPSGRLRFQLALPPVPPGRYRVRVAFAVKDSGHEPLVAAGEFEVRPPPGYVPPRLEPERAPLPFPGSEARPAEASPTPARPAAASGAAESPSRPSGVERRSSSGVGSMPSEASDPSSAAGNVVTGLFPRPVAPPEDEIEPPPVRTRRRAPEPVTDATMPEPGIWPPPASPIAVAPARTGRGADPGLSVDEPVDTDGGVVPAGGLPRAALGAGPLSVPRSNGASPGLDGRPRGSDAPAPARNAGGPPSGAGRAEPPREDARSWPSGSGSEPLYGLPPPTGYGPATTAGDAGGLGLGITAPPVAAARRAPDRHPPRPASSPSPLPSPARPIGARAASSPAAARSAPFRAAPLPDLAPEQTEDLPEVVPTRPTEGWASSVIARMIDAVRRDSYVAVGTAVAASLVLVLLTSALLNAC